MRQVCEGKLLAAGLRFCIVASRFNEVVTARLIDGAIDALVRHGAGECDITVVRVPGAFEIPAAAARTSRSGRYDAIVCVGAVIRGETPHFDYVAAEVAKGVAAVGMEEGPPVTFGVITADTLDQALDRAGGKAGNKGGEAAIGAIELANLYRVLDDQA